MRTDRINAAWLSFRIAAVPPTASAVQVNDMRNCFFAGALAYFVEMNKIAVDDREPTDAEVDEIEGMYRELIAHGASLDRSKRQ